MSHTPGSLQACAITGINVGAIDQSIHRISCVCGKKGHLNRKRLARVQLDIVTISTYLEGRIDTNRRDGHRAGPLLVRVMACCGLTEPKGWAWKLRLHGEREPNSPEITAVPDSGIVRDEYPVT